ncbi:DUF3540 domain-containing protein [Mesorhizobium sp. PL10]
MTATTSSERRPVETSRRVVGTAPEQDGRLLAGTIRAFLTQEQASVEISNGKRVHAVQATSCLLAPAIGDRVLLYVAGSEVHVLAVLERQAAHAAEVSVPGARHVTLHSSETLKLSASKLSLVARDISVLARAIGQTGEILSSNFRRILETVVDKTVAARTITTKTEARTAMVREVDSLTAATLVQNIDNVATQNSEISMVTARQDVRLDAKRVSVG